MKLKIQFGEATRFHVPIQLNFRTWTQFLWGTRLSFRALALAEGVKPCKRHID